MVAARLWHENPWYDTWASYGLDAGLVPLTVPLGDLADIAALDADAAPYLKALEEAFRREESIRTTTQRARSNIKKLQDNFNKIGEAYVKQLAELRRLRGGSETTVSKKKKSSGAKSGEITIPGGDHRSFVAPRQTDKFPMVPGPKEEQ